jgi:hypothetical protein
LSKLVNHKELEQELNRLYERICCVKKELEQCSVVEGCFSSKYSGPGTHALLYDGTRFLFGDITANEAYPTVDTYADLPPANTVVPPNNIYLVLNTTGTWFINRRERGLYASDGVSWTRLGDIQSVFVDDTFQIKDNVDPSKVLHFNVDLLAGPSLKYFQNGNGTVAELKDIPSISIGGNTLGTATILQTGTIVLQGGSNITLSQDNNTIKIIGNSAGTDYISSGQSSLFQQTSLMSGYLGNTYTTHVHSDYLQSSLSSQFLTTQLAQGYSGSNSSGTFQTLSFGNLNGLSHYISNGSLVGSYTVPSTTEFVNNSNTTLFQQMSVMSNYQLIADNTLSLGVTYTSHTHSEYINTNQSSLFQATSDNSLSLGTIYTTHTHTYLGTDQSSLYRFTSDNSQLQYTSEMSNYQLIANNSLSLDTGYTTHAHSQYLNTNQSSLFELSSHTSVFLTTQSNQIASFTSGSSTFESLKFTNSNGFSFNSSTQGIYGSYTVPSDYVSSNQSSLFQQTSATSAITINALNTSQSSLFRHTSADSQLQFTSAMSNYQTTGAYLTTAMVSDADSRFVNSSAALNLTNISATLGSGSISLSVGNYITTARASTDAIGLNTAKTNVTWTVNSSGISLDGGAYFNTSASSNFVLTANSSLFQHTTATSNITSNALNTSASRVINLIAATNNTGGGTVSLSSNISFSNANGLTFYTSAGNAIVGSYTVPTQTVDTNKAGTGFTSVSTAGSDVVGTLNTNGLSLGVPKYLTTAAQSNQVVNSINGSVGQISFATGSSLSSSQNGSTITWGLASNITTALQSAGAYLTTADLSQNSSNYFRNWKLTGNTSGTTSSQQGTDFWLSGGNGVTLSGSSNSILFSVATNYQSQGAYLTTAALSQDSSKYAGTGVTTGGGTGLSATLNTAGLSFNIPSWITTAMQSNAATISNINISGGSTSSNLSNFKLIDSNGVSWSLDTGSKLYATVKTDYQSSGNYLTTARASNDAIGLNTALTANGVSWTVNSSGVSLNVPAFLTTAALSSQIPTLSYFANNFFGTQTRNNSSGSSLIVCPITLPYYVSASYIRYILSQNATAVGTGGTTSANTSYSCEIYTTWGLGLYTNGVGASSRSLQQVSSTSVGMTGRTIYTAGAQGSQYTMTLQHTFPRLGFTTNSYSTSYAVSSGSIVLSSNSNTLFTGNAYLDIPWNSSMSPGIYWLAIGASTSSNSNSSNISFLGTGNIGVSLVGSSQGSTHHLMGAASSASDNQYMPGLGVFTTNVFLISTASIGLNSISATAGFGPAIQMIRQN